MVKIRLIPVLLLKMASLLEVEILLFINSIGNHIEQAKKIFRMES